MISLKNPMEPPEYDRKINNLYYKVGVNGVVFIWLSGQWIRSTKPKSEIESDMASDTDPRKLH